MLVNLSYTITNPFPAYRLIKFDNKEIDQRYKFISHYANMVKYFKYIRGLDDFQKFGHFRINPKIPNFNYKIYKEFINQMSDNEDLFGIHANVFSMHANFSRTYYRYRDVGKIKNYYNLCMLYKQLSGFNEFIICSHLRFNDLNECIAIIQGITRQIEGLSNSLCLENCDRFADLVSCLQVHERTGQPIIFDNLHNTINGNYNIKDYSNAIIQSWKGSGHTPVIHYSHGNSLGRHGFDINKDQLLYILQVFSKHTEKLTVIVELRNAREAVYNFKRETLNLLQWNTDMSFYI